MTSTASKSWTVGKVKITKVTELEAVGGTRFILPQATYQECQKIPWLAPVYANDEGKLRLTIKSLIVETPNRRIVVDTCLGNGKQGRSVPTWNNLDTDFLDRMSAAGYPPDTIDTVFCTHMHVDHVGWNTKLENGQWVPTFTNARYVFVKPEYDHWLAGNGTHEQQAVIEDSVKPVAAAGLVDLVPSDHRLTDELTLIPTYGHSPGHVSIHVKSGGEEGLLTGDVAHSPCQMAHLDWSATVDSDPLQSARTRRELFSRFADTDTLIIGGHFDPGYLKRDGDVFKLIAV